MPSNIAVRAEWDAEASVWYIAETSLPGLNAEADTVEELMGLLPAMIQDLLEEGGVWSDSDDASLSLEVTAHTTTLVRRAAA